jgi:hypothetical protein
MAKQQKQQEERENKTNLLLQQSNEKLLEFEKQIKQLNIDTNANLLLAYFGVSGVGITIVEADKDKHYKSIKDPSLLKSMKENDEKLRIRNEQVKKHNINSFMENVKKYFDEESIRLFKQRLHDLFDYDLSVFPQ